MKRLALQDGSTVRILEIHPNWNEKGWCRRPHVGYVLSGRARLDFETGKPVEVRRGEGFSIPEGRAQGKLQTSEQDVPRRLTWPLAVTTCRAWVASVPKELDRAHLSPGRHARSSQK